MTDFTQTLDETISSNDGYSKRLGGLQNLEGIANISFSITETIAWDTATDWDNSASENGVVHESYGDLPGDGVVQMGYPSTDEGGSSLEAFYVFDSDSGDLVDVTGNGNNATNSGVTQGESGGLFGSTRYNYDGSDDYSEASDSVSLSPSELTVFIVFAADSTANQQDPTLINKDDSNFGSRSYRFYIDSATSHMTFALGDGGGSYFATPATTTNVSTSGWHTVSGSVDGSGSEIVYDGTQEDTSSGGTVGDNNNTLKIGAANTTSTDFHFDGKIEIVRIYSRRLSTTQMQNLHNILSQGHLETGTKSFSSPVQPNLQNLSYNLNGDSIDLKVIGSPGTGSEEVVTQALDGSTSYPLSWSNSHTDFRLRIEFSGGPTTTPTFSGGELI